MELDKLVGTLENKGWTAFGRQRPHEESLDLWQDFPINWDELPRGDGFQREDVAPNRDRDRWQQQWEEVIEQINSAQQRTGSAPPTNVDALAWYLPFHRYGLSSGIYVKEQAVIDLAGLIKGFAFPGIDPFLEAKQLIQQSLAILFFHEMFHHQVECFATRLEISRNMPVYIPYEEKVYSTSLGTDHLLEEAFACAAMLSRLNEPRYCGGIHPGIRRATKEFLMSWIPGLEPGYRLGLHAFFEREVGELLSQVSEAEPFPMQDPNDWRLAPDMTRGFFRVDSVMKVIIPKGHAPVIPWLDSTL